MTWQTGCLTFEHFFSVLDSQDCSLITSTTSPHFWLLLGCNTKLCDQDKINCRVNNRVNYPHLTALAVGNWAPSVLDCLTLLLLGDVTDLVSDIGALNIIHILTLLLVSGLAGGAPENNPMKDMSHYIPGSMFSHGLHCISANSWHSSVCMNINNIMCASLHQQQKQKQKCKRLVSSYHQI